MTKEEAIKHLRRGGKIRHTTEWRESLHNQYLYIKGHEVMYGGNKIPETVACSIDNMNWKFASSGWEIYDDVCDRFLEGIKLL